VKRDRVHERGGRSTGVCSRVDEWELQVRPAGRTDGRTERREEIYARTYALDYRGEDQDPTCKEISSVCLVSSARWSGTGRPQARQTLRLVQDNSERRARTYVHLTWTMTNVRARVKSKSVSISKTDENRNVCAMKYTSDRHEAHYDVSEYNVEY
jgi:hypothetical protein